MMALSHPLSVTVAASVVAGAMLLLPVGLPPAEAAVSAPLVSTQPTGSWAPVQSSPIVSVHSILLNTGKVLQFDGWENPEPTSVFNPADNTFRTIIPASSIFCAGNANMGDGRVLVAGGHGTNHIGLPDTNIFDPVTETWTRVADMNRERWYPSITELADGRFVAISGNSTDASTWADTPEIYDPVANTWTLMTGISTAAIHEEEYPFSYLLPNGTIYTMGPKEDVGYILDVTANTWTKVAGSTGRSLGSSVMYRPGKILYTGGAADQLASAASYAGASSLDLTAPTPAWQATAPMANARLYHTLTMLADGTVLSVGGTPTSPGTATSGVLQGEIWNPSTGTWSSAGTMGVARNYHSTALLMPDATVLVSGGGHDESLGSPGQYSRQVYSPSYLFNGPRPTITSAPRLLAPSATFSVATPDAASVSAVNLVSLGADTHQTDMSQHFVPLAFTAGLGQLSVQMPSLSTAPAGPYMLFIVNGSGVPSVASMVQVGTVPQAPTAVQAVAGNGSATLTWKAPYVGGPISSYTITPFVGATAQPTTTVTGSPAPTTASVGNLTNGTAYTFTVRASNSLGTGPASSGSPPVTPVLDVPIPANGGFESGLTAWTSGGVAPPVVATTAHSGTGSAQIGVAAGAEPLGDSTLSQAITVPATGTSSLSLWYQPRTQDGVCGGSTVCQWDWMEGQLRNGAGSTLASLFKLNNNSATWTRVTADLTPYAGQVVTLWFNVHLDGASPADNTWMFLDDVAVTNSVPPPPVAPAAPSQVAAVAGNGSAIVTWTAPSNGGSAITSYTVTPYLGSVAQAAVSVTGAPPATTATVTGLTNGTAYTFTVTATNAIGSSPPSAASAPVTPSSAPTVVANGGFEAGLASWTGTGPGIALPKAAATAHSGTGSALLGVATGNEPKGDSTLAQTISVPAGTSTLSFWYQPHTADGVCGGSTVCQWDWMQAQLRNGSTTLATLFKLNNNSGTWTQVTADLTAYAGQTITLWFDVHLDGATPPENSWMYLDDVAVSTSAPPAPTAPAVPTGVTASAGNASATVTWSVPANGGSPLTRYTVTPYIGAVAQSPLLVTGTPPTASGTVTGLTNGAAYTFTVSATNAIGTSPPSAASAPVTPSSSPIIVTNGGFESGLASWTTAGVTAPRTSTTAHSGGGSAILGVASGPETLGNSSLSQAVSIPATGTSTLSFWYQPHTADGVCGGTTTCQWDWMEGQVRNSSGTTLLTLFKLNNNGGSWTRVTADLTAYKGQTVTLWFNVHLDGAVPAEDTWMYLDDVSIASG
jgi:hypothetical protein